jgi:hypothetical protein
MLNNYHEFILESLILESKFQFSEKFKQVLSIIPKDNEIKNYILGMQGSDINVSQNYIDISDNKEEVTFIQDRKANQILSDDKLYWMTNNELPSGKYLTFNKNDGGEYKNKELFDILGFTPIEPHKENHPVPVSNIVGEILSETISQKSNKTYVLFKWKDNAGMDRLIVLNKTALNPHDHKVETLYRSNRNPIRIGRLVNSLLNSIGKKVTSQDIENFSNAYKSAFDIYNDAFTRFDIVSGYDISKWYLKDRYDTNDNSTLGQSCMKYDYCQDYFGIYTDNSDVVKLVILYSELNSKVVDGKFKSDFIKGRALLWKTNQGDMFMDRIYTTNDSDVELFKRFSEKNDWWCKKMQNSSNWFQVERKGVTKEPTYTVDLKWAIQEYYPYVDTLSYLRLTGTTERDQSGIISNSADVFKPHFELRDTEGGRDVF